MWVELTLDDWCTLGGYVNRVDGAITFDLEGDDFDDRCCYPNSGSLFPDIDPLLRFTVSDGCSYDLELLLNAYQRDWEEGEFEDVRMTITVGGLPPVRSRTTPKMFRDALPSLLREATARSAE